MCWLMPPDAEAKLTWRDRLRRTLAAFGSMPRALRLVWDTHPPLTIAVGIVAFLQALLPASTAWVGKLVIDSVVSAIAQPAQGIAPVLPSLMLGAGLAVLGLLLGAANQFCQDLLRDLLTLRINGQVIGKAIDLDLETFESPDKQDMLERATRESTFRPLMMLQQTFHLIQTIITLITMIALMLRFSVWIVLLLMAAGLPALYVQAKFAREGYEMQNFRAPEWRRLHYYNFLLTTAQFVKEIKLFGLGKLLLDRFIGLYKQFAQENRALAIRRNLGSLVLQLTGQVAYYGAYIYVIQQTITQKVTLGDLTLYSAVLLQVPMMVQGLMHTLANIYEQNLYLGNLFAFLALKPRVPPAGTGRPVPANSQLGYEFRDVSFQYPGAPAPALQNISLTIRPGEKIALVGENGAGKTTLVKLLTRLYEPTQGQILLEGVDLRELDPGSVQARIGVIFQDFVHYHLTAKENVGFGRLEAMSDPERIQAAAKKSGAHEFLSTLPQAYETMLGRWFAGPGESEGHDLSIGQWQKVALARAFMRDAPVLVLDEPTASLDARAEYEIFKSFRDLAADRTTILISHRFSTVRIADRILVLDQGRIIEQGSHEELLAAGGKYANLFNMQAEGYR